MRLVVTSVILVLSSLAAGDGHEARRPHDDWLLGRGDHRASVVVSADGRELVMSNGLVRRVWRLEPDGACVALDDLMTDRSLLRAVRPEARVTIDGAAYDVGGLAGQPNHAFLTPHWLERMSANPDAFHLTGFEVGEPRPRLEWARVRHHAPDARWPPEGAAARLDFAAPDGGPDGVRVSVHYELYDGLPAFCTWLTVENHGPASITLDRLASEILALVEDDAHPRELDDRLLPPDDLHVQTDYAFVVGRGAWCDHCVHWRADPEYLTQVDYRRRNPCLLVVEPQLGPAQSIGPGERFESFRTFELVHDGDDRERRGLAVRRLHRTVAPWITENPLMMHVRFADPETVKAAIDQCAAVGFEMVILTFGSGFNIEDRSDEYLERMAGYAEYARQRGIEIGGYSLLASRRVGEADDVVMPEGKRPAFGNSPCLCSAWGRRYFQTLYAFFKRSGFTLLEHDGSYPGDVCMSTEHPDHRGLADSRWQQWRRITDFYRWCREHGIYLNVPDYYVLNGATKLPMGYRETNWSLPRAEQVIHTRQNIYDGTWTKPPTMGWMFVPLTEYHGGGEAATIEPLAEHADHYGRMLAANLALGVQACYRGPRLYDGDATRTLVKRHVDWFKRYRDILESDLIHGRRADGRDLDWMLHVNPNLPLKGMLVVFNPLARPVTRSITVDLYYTGLTDTASIRRGHDPARVVALARDYTVDLEVTVPAGGMTWYTVQESTKRLSD